MIQLQYNTISTLPHRFCLAYFWDSLD